MNILGPTVPNAEAKHTMVSLDDVIKKNQKLHVEQQHQLQKLR
jgi:hypothetical protein